MSFLDRIRSNIIEQGLLTRGRRLVVAVSGGADSVALFLALDHLRHEMGFELIVAHYNHALRASAVKDQRFVERLARKRSVLFVTEKNDRKLPVKGSLEEYAREIRYAFLVQVARKHKADAVAVAHTKDDLAETVLMRILRGTGLSGLRSMAFQRDVKGVLFVRPMLNIFRSEIEGFLRDQGAAFVNDPTNRSLKFTRNHIRHKLIPYLERDFSPEVKEHLASLAETVAGDYAFMEDAARMAFVRMAKVSSGKVCLPAKDYRLLPQALRRMILRLAVTHVKAGSQGWSLKCIQALDDFACSSRAGEMSLPERVILIKNKDTFIVKFRKS